MCSVIRDSKKKKILTSTRTERKTIRKLHSQTLLYYSFTRLKLQTKGEPKPRRETVRGVSLKKKTSEGSSKVTIKMNCGRSHRHLHTPYLCNRLQDWFGVRIRLRYFDPVSNTKKSVHKERGEVCITIRFVRKGKVGSSSS